MKISFYLDNSRIKSKNLKNPENGNPGIGGTQYMIWMISYYLKKNYPELEILLFANEIEKLPTNLIARKANSLKEAAILSKKENINYFIFRSVEDVEFYELIDKINLPSIAWAHNFSSKKELYYINSCKNIKRYVCVSKEQYNMLIDHEIIKKSTYIYNCLDLKIYLSDDVISKKNVICYIGSINYAKGFHVICKMWKILKRKVPDLELWVIGNGNLYDNSSILGRYGIAEENYEKKFIKYILDNSGNIHKDIIFYGLQSEKQKIKLMKQAKVGLVNPTAKTETFCISAIEFEALGVPVVTKKKNGFLDTVKNKKTGFLHKTKKGKIKSILKLLSNYELNQNMGENGIKYVKENFNIDTVIDDWYTLFLELEKMSGQSTDFKKNIKLNNNNLLRTLNYNVKKIYFFNKLPAIYEYKYYIKDVIKFFKRG